MADRNDGSAGTFVVMYTTEITRKDDAQGFDQNKSAAVRGGRVAGNARKELEEQTKQSVMTKQNYLSLTTKTKQKKLKNGYKRK